MRFISPLNVLQKRVSLILVFVTLLLYLVELSVNAVSTEKFDVCFLTNDLSVRSGKVITITVRAADSSTAEIAGFYLEIELDETVFQMKRMTPLGGVTAGELDTEQTDGLLKMIYYDSDAGKSPIKPVQSGIFSLDFYVSESAAEGSYSFEIVAGSFVDVGRERVEGFQPSEITAQILPPLSDNTDIKSLEVSGFTLSPQFSPDITYYTLEVPSVTSSLAINVQTNHTGATSRISRTTLKSPGNTTEITITVTAEDGVTKEKYTLAVYREEKESSGKVSGSSKPAAGKPTTSSSYLSGEQQGKKVDTGEAADGDNISSATLNAGQLSNNTFQPLLMENSQYFSTFFIGLGGGLVILLFYLMLRKRGRV